ncbi:DMT family transporter [Crenalkalicoccus roseus]|uniref:DMT family transporter n=1 Tax=Crenalkalicoccus roseus TaxID=1485588 RepID=UPI001EFFDF70|nr:DMT family transporter [Crenalkalicoccus roseus]
MKGPALLLAGIVVYGLLDANNKLLSGQYGLGQVIAFRYLVLIGLFLAARAVWRGAFGPIGTTRPWLHLLRALSMMVGAAGFFLAFRQLPLAEGYLVFFTAPFMTLALAATVLRERVPPAAWAWCAVGFAGVLLAVAPKLTGGGPLLGYLSVLMGTASFAVTQTVNRMLRDEPGIARILFWPSLLGILLYGPFALRDWVAPPPLHLAMLAASGVLAGAAVALTAAAFRHADAARLGTYGYAALPVSVALDLLIWGTPPDPMTLLGGAVVVVACLMSERARLRAAGYGKPGGKRWAPSAPSGRAATERTAESGSGP